MKVVLINPKLSTWSPNVYLPLGLAYVASALERARHDVSIVDMNCKKITDDKLVSDLKSADMIGITGMITEYNEVVRLAGLSRGANKRAKIVFGGGLATTHTKEVLSASQADYAVIGEGEKTVVDLALSIEGGRNCKDVKDIKGIAYKTDGVVNITPPVEQIEDLDTIAYPARYLLDMSRYTTHHFKSFGIKHLKVKSATLLSSRGCPYFCQFCYHGVWGHKWRGRSAENIIDEIKHLNERYGFNAFVFNDDTFVMNKQRVMDFCKLLLDTKLGVKWYANGRINLMSEEMLNAMAEAGCVGIGYGLESGNQAILDSIRKEIKLEDVVRVVRLTQKAGINITGYFMFGMMGETKANIRETIDFARGLGLNFYAFAMYAPIIGTPLYNTAQAQGLIKEVKLDDWSFHATANLTKDCTMRDLERFSEEAFREFTIQKRYGKVYLLNPILWFDGLKSLFFVMGKRNFRKMITKAWWVIRRK
jgi:radical SAM superfamily enzyme YgiQ (UPF0313 family)